MNIFLFFAFIIVLIILCKKNKRKQNNKQNTIHPWAIPDKYKTFEELQTALKEAGLESSNLIFAIDFTKSNEWTGTRTFGNKCMHSIIPGTLNPYQQVIEIIGQTLEPFDDDNLIPAYGFGDQTTTDKSVFPFFPDRPCKGFREVLQRYTEIAPFVKLAGPTSFAPIIYEAIRITRQTKSYHILIIVADGQITNEEETTKAIVEASNYPLSIIVIGVGDGPWDTMKEYDDGLPQRKFDNFQFVAFHEVLIKYDGNPLAFATLAMQEIPEQYKAIRKLKYL